MSASALTATVAGWPGAGGINDHTVEPRLTTGFCGLSAEATSIAARPADGAGARGRRRRALRFGRRGRRARRGALSGRLIRFRRSGGRGRACRGRLDALGDLCRRLRSGGAVASTGGLIARSCGFWRIRIAAPATARTTPRATAAAIHSHGFGLPSSLLGATGRWPSKSCRAPAPGRSNSPGTSGAAANSTGSSGRVATTGGAAEACTSSAHLDRADLARSGGGWKLSSLASFVPIAEDVALLFAPGDDAGLAPATAG